MATSASLSRPSQGDTAVGVAVGLGVGADVGVGVWVGVGVLMPVPAGVGVSVGVAVGLGVGADVGVGVWVGVGVLMPVPAGVGVSVGVAVGLGVGADVGVGVWVGVGVLMPVPAGVGEGMAVGVAVDVSVGVGAGAGSSEHPTNSISAMPTSTRLTIDLVIPILLACGMKAPAPTQESSANLVVRPTLDTSNLESPPRPAGRHHRSYQPITLASPGSRCRPRSTPPCRRPSCTRLPSGNH